MLNFRWNRAFGLLGILAALAVTGTAEMSHARPGNYPDHRDPRLGLERLPIHLNGQEFRAMQGQDTVPLRALLERTYGRGVTQGRELVRVVVLAKSRFGRGQMQLLVGNNITYPQAVFGDPRTYDYPGGYSRLVFDNPSPGFSQGVWQLKLQGLIRIERIVVVTRSPWVVGGPQPAPYPYPDDNYPDDTIPGQPYPQPGRPGPRPR